MMIPPSWCLRSIQRHICEKAATADNFDQSEKSNVSSIDSVEDDTAAETIYDPTLTELATTIFSKTALFEQERIVNAMDELRNSNPRLDKQERPISNTKTTATSGIIDGNLVEFELKENITQEKPEIDRLTRISRITHNKNIAKPSWEIRFRLWILKFQTSSIFLMYLGVFVLLNVIFAGLFMITDDKCCDNPTQTFAETFDFAIQTSTTIGYGGYVPIGRYSNFLVVVLFYATVTCNTICAGLLFLKFITPTAKLIFSDVMTVSNIYGLPCLELRVGNADGRSNQLVNATARLTVAYVIPSDYVASHEGYDNDDDENDENNNNNNKKNSGSKGRICVTTQELKLTQPERHDLDGVWTLRHALDETSPLFGIDFLNEAGKLIYVFSIGINVTQTITNSTVTAFTAYNVQDLMIGHRFCDQTKWDPISRTAIIDYDKMNRTTPAKVWYPIIGRKYAIGKKKKKKKKETQVN